MGLVLSAGAEKNGEKKAGLAGRREIGEASAFSQAFLPPVDMAPREKEDGSGTRPPTPDPQLASGTAISPALPKEHLQEKAPALSHLKHRRDLVKITPSMRLLYSHYSRYKEFKSRAGSRGGKCRSHQFSSHDKQPGTHLRREPHCSLFLEWLHKLETGSSLHPSDSPTHLS